MVKGKGDEIKPGDTVFVHYRGVIMRTGEEFDSSWSRGEFSHFNAATDEEAAEVGAKLPVIRGFRDALVGQTVGSRVMSIVPAEDGGYGGERLKSMGHEEDDVMVFVLDILGSMPATVQ
nr:FKBP-type peptidyl-prolyl cis-trans isomerase [Leucobacter chinensis]